jgi:hypothetical protein
VGFQYRKRIRTGKNSWVNLSKSGVSGSFRVGPMTFNSRGRRSVRLGNGMSYRTSGSGCALMACALVLAGLVVVVLAL